MKKSTYISIIIILVLAITTFVPFQTTRAEGDEVRVTLNNKTGAKTSITFQGPKFYMFELKAGKIKVEMRPGNYYYSYTACGEQKTGYFLVKNAQDKLILEKCKGAANTKNAKLIPVTIQNDTRGTAWLSLNGPAVYSFTVKPGRSTISVIKGKYTYTIRACGTSTSGKIQLKRNKVWRWWCTYY